MSARSDHFTVVVCVPLVEALRQQLQTQFPDVRFLFSDQHDLPDGFEVADVVIPWGVSTQQLASMQRLRWVQTVSAGVDRMDFEELRRRGIPLTNSSGIHANNIAEHIMSLMLAFARKLPYLVREQEQHRWSSEVGRISSFEITGQTLLVLGLGKIGEQLAVRGKGMQMRVIATRRRIEIDRESVADEVFPLSALAERIGEADHVAITLPLTRDTEGLFSAALIEKMKPGAYLYNIGRGSIIDQDALIKALQSGRLGGAGLDVTTPEPLPAASPLWDLDNVIITPHTSGSSPKLMERAVALWIDNLKRFLAGEPLRNVVDLDAGY
jgi:phosphoglycerate dehydrogenase-like enzyme